MTTLIDKINQASDYIAKAGRNGSANYIIVSPRLAEIIENLDMNSSNLELLFKAYIQNNDELFHELAMQIIKDEEKKKHHLLISL